MNSGAKSVLRSSCVKIYLCSNPEDSVLERRVLRESVFPKLRDHCRHSLGLDVRVIDPFESSDRSRWPDEDTRQQLINECRESSAGPFLLCCLLCGHTVAVQALVGHQYGAASLPSRVEVSEYQLLLHEGQKAGIRTQEVERKYQRDENSVPTCYCLPTPSTHTSAVQPDGEEEVRTKVKEDELAKVFQTAASVCVNRGLMAAERAARFSRSVMDADLRFALESDIIQHRGCMIYIHKVINAKGQEPKTPGSSGPSAPLEDLRPGTSHEALLAQLCDNFLPSLVNSSHVLVYTTTTECDRRHGYTTARRKAYVDSLCQQLHHDLVGLTKRANVSDDDGDDDDVGDDARARESAEQEHVCVLLSRFYEVVRPEEQQVRGYVVRGDLALPLVVTGGPCSGKAVLLAHCAQQVQSWLPDTHPVVLTYFYHPSTSRPPGRLLSSLCREIPRRYRRRAASSKRNLDDRDGRSRTEGSDEDAVLGSASGRDLHHNLSNTSNHQKKANLISFGLSELQEHFCSLLSLLPSAERPLVLVLDGLDHLEKHLGSRLIGSLPSPLPPHVKVVLSASPSSREILKALSPQRPWEAQAGEPGYLSVSLGTADRRPRMKMLASLLSSCGRKVTSGQQALVNQALSSCGLTLYVRLLHLHVSLWTSDSDVTESGLPGGVHSSISSLLDRLEQKHGPAMVGRAVSYLSLSRTGLTEVELADLLTRDHRVLSAYPRTGGEAPSVPGVPQTDVETLLLDLRRVLIGRTVAGTSVYSWLSRHFSLVITKRYLATSEARRDIHSAMADYFSGGGSWGPGPRLLRQKSPPSERRSSSRLFDLPGSSRERRRANARKILELPHHLQGSERWEQMEEDVLMSFRFHQAMIEAGLLEDLVALLESEDGRLLRERAFIASVLKSSACFLQTSPLQLPTVMETHLLPYRGVFPPLKVYFSDLQQQRRDSEGLVGVALCPAPSSTPPFRCLTFNHGGGGGSVAEVAVTDSGVVAQVLDDGSAWFWVGPGSEVAKLSLTSEQQELRFAGVKTSGQLVLLSTLCNRLFFWNVSGPETFVPLQVHLDPNQQGVPTKAGGFVACQGKLFTWWRNRSSVSMFDVSGEAVRRFQCLSSVSCSVCSLDASRLFCGQQDGSVSLFATDTGGVLATWTNPSHQATLWMSFSEEKQEVACGDEWGNIALWELAAQTPRLVWDSCCGSGSDPVLSTDHSGGTHSLLVCQAARVSLWDTSSWELRDQFSAPPGRLFTQAVLSQDGDLILASLDRCPSILVWRLSTGECVLSLKSGQQPRALLKTASDVLCVDVDAQLTAWDSASIGAAAAAPKMRLGVRDVVVERSGRCFYTADGSETVWRWQMDSGLPHAHVLHDDPVDKLCLSPDDLHLVTLSAGDVHVWRTETGQNVVRVSGSRATDVLVTPNANFGVSLSQQHLSQVWKLSRGSVVCSIRLHLSDAQVSPESTFLIGRHRGDLLAASLWSGCISKRFSCAASRELVAAFHTLSQHPDFVMVMCVSGSVYTWNLAEETLCRHLQLPQAFHRGLPDAQMSSDGSYALLSVENQTVAILDLSQGIICSLKTEGPVLQARLDKAGGYVAYVWSPPGRDSGCSCSQPLLAAVRLRDGRRMGSVRLPEEPLSLQVCEQRRVFVGFRDGSVGVYWISDGSVGGGASVAAGELCGCVKTGGVDRWLPLSAPNVTWL